MLALLCEYFLIVPWSTQILTKINDTISISRNTYFHNLCELFNLKLIKNYVINVEKNDNNKNR